MADASFRSPIVDLFRRGEVPRDVRMLAADGTLVPSLHDQLTLLILLAGDGDADVARTADATLARIPVPALQAFLARSDAPADVREFFAARGIVPAEAPGGDEEFAIPPPGGGPPAPPAESDPVPPDEGDEKKSTLQRLALMTVAEKVKAAMMGTREERSVLIRDPNKLVASAVLSSPKLTEPEVENIAKMANVSEEVLRVIGHARKWSKSYVVASSLARNPKTPIAISLNLVARLNERDVKAIALDRNIPEPLRVAARKMMTSSQSRRQ